LRKPQISQDLIGTLSTRLPITMPEAALRVAADLSPRAARSAWLRG
jgi:hypothetical protein